MAHVKSFLFCLFVPILVGRLLVACSSSEGAVDTPDGAPTRPVESSAPIDAGDPPDSPLADSSTVIAADGDGLPDGAIDPPSADGGTDSRADNLPDSGVGASVDAGAGCTPLTYPLPFTCPATNDLGSAITSPGRLYFWQHVGMPYCVAEPYDGVAACQDCAEHYHCACLRAFTDAGCVDTDAGPYVYQPTPAI